LHVIRRVREREGKGMNVPNFVSRFWEIRSPCMSSGKQLKLIIIADTCPLIKVTGGLQSLHDVDNDALNWQKPRRLCSLDQQKIPRPNSSIASRQKPTKKPLPRQ